MKAQGAPQKLRFTIQAVSGEVREIYLPNKGWREGITFAKCLNPHPGNMELIPTCTTRRTPTTQFENSCSTALRREDGTLPGE